MDVALKQRLVGATVLVALAVIVLPMLLGGRPEDGVPESREIQLPPQPAELDFETRRFPVGETRAARAEPASSEPGESEPAPPAGPRDVAHVELQPRDFTDALESGANTDTPASEPAPVETPEQEVRPEPARAEAPAAAAADSPPARATEPARASAGRYVVQVASFGSAENATRLTRTLGGYGYGVLSDVVSSEVGRLHRVRVGPYDSEAEAQGAVTRLRSQVDGVNPRVVDLTPEQAAQVTAPADPLVRWVVQAGSFGSENNADTLVGKLRGLGLTAYKESVAGSGGTVYRVRVGPFIEREEAIRANQRVTEELALNGVVMSAD